VSFVSPVESSSKVRPDQKVSSNLSARDLRTRNDKNLSTAIAHDHKDANIKIIMTALTTQSARKNKERKEKSPLCTGLNVDACIIKSNIITIGRLSALLWREYDNHESHMD